MRALRVHGPHIMKIEEVPDPRPGANEILVAIKAAAICRTDIEIFAGTMVHLKTGLLKLPRIPGHEWAGVVTEVGSAVTRFKLGDRVTGDTAIGCGVCRDCLAGHYNICATRQTVGVLRKDGAFADYLVMPEKHVYRIPKEVSFEEASLAEPAGVALHAIQRLSPAIADRVVVIGDGPVGLLGLQMVLIAGASQVAVIGGYDFKLDVAKQLGASFTIGRCSPNLEEQVIQSLGDAPDCIIDAAGRETSLPLALKLVRPGGKIVDITFCGINIANWNADMMVAREITVIGSLAGPNTMPQVLQLMAQGRLNVKPLITQHYSLAEADKAFEMIETRSQPYLRVILTPDGK